MSNNHRDLLLKTILYSDIFDFPLTREEVKKYVIADREISNFKLQISNDKLVQKITYQEGFYFLKGRENLVELREKREKISLKKIEIAKRAAVLLSKIPTVQLIGISGNVAMLNAEKDDDIDLFIITKHNTVWSTRLVATLVLDLLGMRRKKGQKKVKDKICLNYFLGEDSLCMPKEKQDLYTAHEVVQLFPLFERENTYQKFILANEWVKEYLPNAINNPTQPQFKKNTSSFLSDLFAVLEPTARFIQKIKIGKPRETETVTNSVLAFHPENYRGKVLEEYSKRLIKYHL